jgi:soluble lytic murein transglycosylase
MAQQLLQARTPQAYAGVEAYAAKHQNDEAGPLAWLVLGYAHSLDSDYPKALSAWRNAQPLTTVMGDVLDYLRASAYQGQKDPASVITVLEGFEQRYPESVLQHEAGMLYANALTATGEAKKAIVFLEHHRQPLRSDVEFALGQAYQGAEEREKAAAVYSRIYYDMPLSPEADTIRAGLLSFTANAAYDARFTRADLLLKGKRYSQAAAELAALADEAPESQLSNVLGEQGVALYRDHKRDAAQKVLERVLKSGKATREAQAQAYYVLAEIAREKDDTRHYHELLEQLRMAAPESPWLQETLLSTANMYLLKKDYETAVRFYSELAQRDRQGKYSSYAHWKAAWLTYRMGRKEEAQHQFEEHLEIYPASAEVPPALYWRGRLAEAAGDLPLARACYGKISDFFRYFYYANLARERLAITGAGDVAAPAYLGRLSRPTLPPQSWDPPTDNLRSHKADLLANAALFDFAVKELRAAANGSPPWQAVLVAQMYGDAGNYLLSIETLKRAVPGYFASDLGRLPKPVWDLLFPRPYWGDLKKYSESNQLDPYLVASLMRQESEFSPVAISSANAMGLMQLLPQVGKGVAREEKVHNFSTDQLLQPAINIQLGTRYFKHMVDHFKGKVEFALAAYNAGEERVEEWRNAGSFQEMAEFVESIPFTQTREYVQAIMRNAVLYKLLYAENNGAGAVSK